MARHRQNTVDKEIQLNKNKLTKESMAQTKLRRKTQVCKVITVKIKTNKLNQKQKEALKMLFIEAKWIKNEMLANSNNGNSIFIYKVSDTVLVKNKDKEFEQRELKYISVQQIQSVIEDVKTSVLCLSKLRALGHKVGSLKFISECKSINLKQPGVTYKIKSGKKMKIQGVPRTVYVNGLEQLKENYELANAKLLSKPDGYYVAITVYINENDIQDNFVPQSKIGLDMGIKDNIILSDGKKINVFIEESERLKTLQRQLSRQQNSSNNRWKTLKKIRKEYQKMNNLKENISNKIVSDLKQYEFIYFQDENLKGWKNKRSLAKGSKKIQHSILGRVKTKLKRCERAYMLNQFIPTTQTCVCGEKNKLSLDDRIYSCSCGYSEDRDIHSAKMMIVLGEQLIGTERIKSTPVEIVLDKTNPVLVEQRSEKQEASRSLA